MGEIKGWIHDAAVDIKKRDSLEVEVVTSIIKKHHSAKLRRGPIESDASPTVMPVPRCDRCAHWKPLAHPDRGRCTLHSDQPSMLTARLTREIADEVITYAEFGCVEFAITTRAQDDAKKD